MPQVTINRRFCGPPESANGGYAWPISREGRKLGTGSALFAEDGTLHAMARAVWIKVAG